MTKSASVHPWLSCLQALRTQLRVTLPDASVVAIVAVVASSTVALAASGTQATIAWADRRQRVAEAKADRLWTAKSDALHQAAIFATRLDRMLAVDVRNSSPLLLVRLREVCESLEHGTAASIAAYASPEVLAKFNLVLNMIIVLQPERSARVALSAAAHQKEEALDASDFAAAAEARAEEVALLEKSGLAAAFTQRNISAIREAVDELTAAIRADIQA